MKRKKVHKNESLSVGAQNGAHSGVENEGKVGNEKGFEVSGKRMLDNLKLALLFSRIQGRMAKEE